MQTERDTVEVIAFLKHEDSEKVQKVQILEQQVKDLQLCAQVEKDKLILDYKNRMDELHSHLLSKDKEVRFT